MPPLVSSRNSTWPRRARPLDGDIAAAAAKLEQATEKFEASGVVPDPDDAAEIASLRARVTSRA